MYIPLDNFRHKYLSKVAEWQYTSTSGFVSEYWRYSIARPSADQVLSHTSLGPGLDGDTKYYLLYYMLYNIMLYYVLGTLNTI